MITGEIKNKVDRMWEYFWTGGLTNPVDVIEQLTYLIFMKRLDQEEQRKEKEQKLGSIFGNFNEKFIFGENHQDIRWSNLIQLGDPKQLYDKVRNEAFEFIKNLDEDKDSVFSQYMENAIFKVPTPAVLQNTMDTIEEIFNNPQMVEDKDTKGDLYEYLLSKLSTSGKNGQFRTPKYIINMMVELMKPTVEDKIIDPACGFRVIIMTQANSQVNTRVLELLPKFKIKKMNCAVKSSYYENKCCKQYISIKEELTCLRQKKIRLKQKVLLFKFILKTLKTTI